MAHISITSLVEGRVIFILIIIISLCLSKRGIQSSLKLSPSGRLGIIITNCGSMLYFAGSILLLVTNIQFLSEQMGLNPTLSYHLQEDYGYSYLVIDDLVYL